QDGAVGGVGDADPGPLDGRRIVAHGDHHLQGPPAYVCRIHNGIPPFRILVYAPTGPAVPSGVGGTTRQGVKPWSISSNTAGISCPWATPRRSWGRGTRFWSWSLWRPSAWAGTARSST